jgi:ribonucleoside-diphosphate reductase beta chain
MTALFTHDWALSLGAALEASPLYREAARRWEGAVCLERTANPDDPAPSVAVFLDLAQGHCRAARLATAQDHQQARYVISGPLTAWLTVLRGDEGPTVALMRGHLRLAKGLLPMLLPHVGAANALVDVARMVSPPDQLGGITTAPAAVAPAAVEAAVTTDRRLRYRSLDPDAFSDHSVPLRLWDKAKRYGIWNPADIDFSIDGEQWAALAADEQDLLLRLVTLFQGGEEAVVIDILPLLDVVSQEGRLDEQLYLTSFVWEEAKHVEGMHRFLHAVGALDDNLARFHSPSYHTIFSEALPQAMQALRHDRSPVVQARASATYNMIVEGVLAETGYHVLHEILVSRDILPGMQKMTGLLKLDESRHIAYGLYLLSRLGIEHGEPVWNTMTDTMNALMDPAVAVITEAFAAYPADAVPFGLSPAPFVDYAMTQFGRRLDRLERAREQGIPVGMKD